MSRKVQNIMDSLDKAYTGPVTTLKEWDIRTIPTAIRNKLKEHGLEKTYDPENPINCSDELADRFWVAGKELALELGLFCEDTERIIKITEEEYQDTVKNYQRENLMGTGKDQVVMRPRRPEDPTEPLMCASLGLVCSEELYLPLVEGIIRYPKLVDVLHGPTLSTVYGRKVRSGSPYETLMGHYESQLKKEALWRAGREGMSLTGVAGACTEYGHLGGAPALPGYGNNTMSLCPVELKCTFSNFHRIIQGLNYGHKLRVGGFSYIGGYAGPVEGAVLANIATEILLFTIMQADYVSSYVYDLKLFGNCGRKALWGNSVGTQAVSRNTKFMRNKIVNETAGPNTDMFLYESAVGNMNHCVSGASKTTQPRSAGGRYTDYITPQECWWVGEVFKSCAGMTREKANEVAKKVLPLYEEQLSQPPKGQSIYECYDLEKQEPSPEYKARVDRIREELIGYGMPLGKVFE